MILSKHLLHKLYVFNLNCQLLFYIHTHTHTHSIVYVFIYGILTWSRLHNELLKWLCFQFICGCCCNCCNLFYCVKVKAIVKCFIITDMHIYYTYKHTIHMYVHHNEMRMKFCRLLWGNEFQLKCTLTVALTSSTTIATTATTSTFNSK